MDEITITNLLTNSGLNVVGMDSDFIYFVDPSCIFPAFDTLLEYAWMAILVMTAIMLFGWAMLIIRNGVKIDDLFNNARALILVFCTLAVVKPLVNIVYGENLFAQQCEIKQASRAMVNELLEMRNKKFGKSDEYLLYENFSVIDSGPNYTEQVKAILTNSEINEIDSQSTSSGLTVSDIVSAQSQNGAVIYTNADGIKIKRTGGSAAWRNNNPGNIVKSKFAYANGAIGESGRFAIFPDEETGLRATMNLLRSKNYNNLPLRQVYHKWAPSSDGNRPTAYANQVSQMSGVSLDKRINELSDDELHRVARAMQQIEGWTPGTEERI